MWFHRICPLLRPAQTILLTAAICKIVCRENRTIYGQSSLPVYYNILHLRESGTYTHNNKMVEPVFMYNSFTSVFIIVVLKWLFFIALLSFSYRNKTSKYFIAINPKFILVKYLYNIVSLLNRFYNCVYIAFSL